LTLGLHRIIATCDPRNIPSVRIMEKLGMRREAEFVDSVVLGDGEWHNEYFYAITKKEWGKRFD
jgi:Acetyltransferases, including N-acetylases of ribosomal proteins